MDLTRWRNSHGFGVHSPFGYMIAKGVVSLGSQYSYYAEKEISALARREKLPSRHGEHYVKLHRLVNLLHIRNAYTPTSPNKCLKHALNRAGVKVYKFRKEDLHTAFSDGPVNNLYIFENGVENAVAEKILSVTGNALLIYGDDPNGISLSLQKILKSGIIITGHFCTLVLSRIQTQPVCYRMNI